MPHEQAGRSGGKCRLFYNVRSFTKGFHDGRHVIALKSHGAPGAGGRRPRVAQELGALDRIAFLRRVSTTSGTVRSRRIASRTTSHIAQAHSARVRVRTQAFTRRAAASAVVHKALQFSEGMSGGSLSENVIHIRRWPSSQSMPRSTNDHLSRRRRGRLRLCLHARHPRGEVHDTVAVAPLVVVP